MNELKSRYQEIWSEVDREGVKELIEWLDTTDFYTAPSSTKYHLAREGGLLEHSLNVFNCLDAQNPKMEELYNISYESIIICTLGHDLCKINFYGQEMRNVKEDGVWVQKPYYTVNDQFPYGHGEKSALLVNKHIKLKPSEFMAIRWHMGGFTPGIQDYSLSQAMSEAFRQYPLALLLHMADMEATYLLETKD